MKALQKAVRHLYLEACALELQALKPGNVGLHSPGHGMCAEDFLISAAVSGFDLVRPGLPLGLRIYHAVWSTREAVATNTNLGIILLCAPLVQAVMEQAGEGRGLHAAVQRVLRETDIEDARWVYRAIRIASPGGLGESEQHDVRADPDCDLNTAMAVAAKRDRIAAQYCNGFADLFEYAVPRLVAARQELGDEAWAATALYLGLLRRFPDSHVARKFGMQVARQVSARAARLEAELHQVGRSREFADKLLDADTELKRAGINPGTTADFTVATLLAVRLERLLADSSLRGDAVGSACGRIGGRAPGSGKEKSITGELTWQ